MQDIQAPTSLLAYHLKIKTIKHLILSQLSLHQKDYPLICILLLEIRDQKKRRKGLWSSRFQGNLHSAKEWIELHYSAIVNCELAADLVFLFLRSFSLSLFFLILIHSSSFIHNPNLSNSIFFLQTLQFTLPTSTIAIHKKCFLAFLPHSSTFVASIIAFQNISISILDSYFLQKQTIKFEDGLEFFICNRIATACFFMPMRMDRMDRAKLVGSQSSQADRLLRSCAVAVSLQL